MDSFVDRMERMRVNADSPDGSVKASYTVRAGVSVSLDDRHLAKHNEKSLAEQASAVIRGIFSGYHKGTGAIATERATGSADPRPDSEAAILRQRYRERVDEIDVIAVSPRRCAKVRLRGNAPPEVRIRPGTLGRMDIGPTVMESEINAVITEASNEFGAQRGRAWREIYDGHH